MRSLTSGKIYSYRYDLNNLRTSKTVNGVVHEYVYLSGRLIRETYSGNELYFFYDAGGRAMGFWYIPNGGTKQAYYYRTNLQGDVTVIYDTSGAEIATYNYDPYGNPLTSSDSSSQGIGAINPLRYRGYYYDTETGFYYLQSRYYDPVICRFINADTYASTGQGFVGCNMFAYCGNNPVDCVDPTGHLWSEIWEFIKAASTEIKQVLGELSPIYTACGSLAFADGPLLFGDLMAAAGISLLTVGAIGYGAYQATQALLISLPKTREREKEKSVSITEKSNNYQYWKHF